MMAIEDTKSCPRYSCEFRELNWERLRPPGIRYQPRPDPVIGMFDTARAAAKTSRIDSIGILSQAQIAQAQANRKPNANRTARPHSIATRAIEAMRQHGGWVSTGELVELANRHTPEGCVNASRANIYEALADWRKKGVIQSRAIAQGSQVLEWRITQ